MTTICRPLVLAGYIVLAFVGPSCSRKAAEAPPTPPQAKTTTDALTDALVAEKNREDQLTPEQRSAEQAKQDAADRAFEANANDSIKAMRQSSQNR